MDFKHNHGYNPNQGKTQCHVSALQENSSSEEVRIIIYCADCSIPVVEYFVNIVPRDHTVDKTIDSGILKINTDQSESVTYICVQNMYSVAAYL